MATRDPRRLTDGFTTLDGGVDSGISPSLIGQNQIASAINAQMRGGFIKPRPGVNKRTLQFPGFEASTFEDGKFQGARRYLTNSGDDVLMASIGGHIFRIDVANGFIVQDVTITKSTTPTVVYDPNSSILEYVWMEQAEEFFVVQDGVSAPYIYNGASARRAGPTEIPTGTVMAYVMGRLWIASPNRRQFVASDLVYGPSGTATYDYRDSVLKMTENALLATGGAFSVPDNAGEITAMIAPAVLDTSTGQGPLQVFTRTMAFACNAPVDRTIWRLVTYPIFTKSLINYGPLGQRSCVQVNSDIWYRAQDAVRSFILGRRNFESAQSWANAGMSDEIRTILDYDQQETLDRASTVNFDNRLLTTISPVWTPHGTYFRGLAVIDFHTVSGMRRSSPPAWNGVWTGLKILQILTATVHSVERCFMFVLSSANKIELWELSRADKSDNNGSKRIVWSHEDRSCSFGDTGLLQLITGEQFIDELYGRATFTLQFRPDQYPLWLDWTAWSECSTFQDCNPPVCGEPQTGPKQHRLQYRPNMMFPRPPDGCEADVDKVFDQGYEFQVRQTIEGYCRIKRLMLAAHWKDEPVMGECRSEGPCFEVTGCDINPFTYTAE